MSTDQSHIKYVFNLGDEEVVYNIDTGFKLSKETRAPLGKYPDWTLLEESKCAVCPLSSEEHRYCPAAIRMHAVLERFKGHGSIQKLKLRVETERRNYEVSCDLQSGLNSMLGLQMATSGCPIVGRLRNMVQFHIPYSSFAETLYRAVSGYLTKQYFIQQEGGTPDWELNGLKDFYLELESLNGDFSQRIGTLDQNDAISNAIVMFFSTSSIVAELIDEGLVDFAEYFTGERSTPPQNY